MPFLFSATFYLALFSPHPSPSPSPQLSIPCSSSVSLLLAITVTTNKSLPYFSVYLYLSVCAYWHVHTLMLLMTVSLRVSLPVISVFLFTLPPSLSFTLSGANVLHQIT